jgi:protein-L-isoaspartate(D-aspartate) O-methyltransferase
MKESGDRDDRFFVARASLILALRSLGITDHKLLEAFESVPHEVFVPDDYLDYAYKDASLPIGNGQSITSPLMLARLIAVLDVADTAKLLEIGTGSGYSAMLLSRFCRRVFSLEKDRQLMAAAVRRWRELGADHIVGFVKDGLSGLPNMAPFDRILLTGSIPALPERLAGQLTDEGILVAAVGPATERQTITTVQREGSELVIAEHGTVRLPPLSPSLP